MNPLSEKKQKDYILPHWVGSAGDDGGHLGFLRRALRRKSATENRDLGKGREYVTSQSELQDLPGEETAVLETLKRTDLQDSNGMAVGTLSGFKKIRPPRRKKKQLCLYSAILHPPESAEGEGLDVILKFGIGETDVPMEKRVALKDMNAYEALDTTVLPSGRSLSERHPVICFIPSQQFHASLGSGGVLVMGDLGERDMHTVMTSGGRQIIKTARAAISENLKSEVVIEVEKRLVSGKKPRTRKRKPQEEKKRGGLRKRRERKYDTKITIQTTTRKVPLRKKSYEEQDNRTLQLEFRKAAKKLWPEGEKARADGIIENRQLENKFVRNLSIAAQELRRRKEAYEKEWLEERGVITFMPSRGTDGNRVRNTTFPVTVAKVARKAMDLTVAEKVRQEKMVAAEVFKREYLRDVREQRTKDTSDPGAHLASVMAIRTTTLDTLDSILTTITGDGRYAATLESRIQEATNKLRNLDLRYVCSPYSSTCLGDGHWRNAFVGRPDIRIERERTRRRLRLTTKEMANFLAVTPLRDQAETSEATLGWIDLHTLTKFGTYGSPVLTMATQLAHRFVYKEQLVDMGHMYSDQKGIKGKEREIMEEAGAIVGLTKEQINCQRRLATIMMYAIKALRGMREHPDKVEEHAATLDDCLKHIDDYRNPAEQWERKHPRDPSSLPSGAPWDFDAVATTKQQESLTSVLRESHVPVDEWPPGKMKSLVLDLERGDCQLVRTANGGIMRITQPAMVQVVLAGPDGKKYEMVEFGSSTYDQKSALKRTDRAPRELPASMSEKVRFVRGEDPLTGGLRGLQEELGLDQGDYFDQIQWKGHLPATIITQGPEMTYPGLETVSLPELFTVTILEKDTERYWDHEKHRPKMVVELEREKGRINTFRWKQRK